MISQQRMSEIKKKFAIHEKDSGSIELQVAILTEEINNLNEHFKAHKHDFGSKRGLLKKVGKRRSFLNYLERTDSQKYKDIISNLGIRK